MSGSAKGNRAPFDLHYAWLVFAGCCCLMAGGLGAVLNSSGIFLVPIAEELGFTRGELALYLSFYMIAMVFASPIVGNLLPRANIRILMTCMFILVCLAEGLMSVYTQLWQWYASGIVFGLCGTFCFILPTPLMIGNWFNKRRGLVLGIAMSFSGIGTAIWSPLFTFLIQNFGWRITYVLVACIMAVLVLPWTMFVFRYRPSDMGLQPYGVKTDEAIPRTDKGTTDPKFLSGVPVKAAVFSTPFACIFLLCGLDEFYGGFGNQIPGFANSIGETAAFGATLLSIMSIGNIAIKICVGWLVDKIGVPRTVVIQLCACLIACLMFAFFREIWTLYFAAFLLGVQNSVVTVAEPLLVRHFFGEKNYAQLYSYCRVAGGIMGAFGIPAVAFIYDLSGGYELAFIIGAFLAVFLALLTILASFFKKHLKWVEAESIDGV